MMAAPMKTNQVETLASSHAVDTGAGSARRSLYSSIAKAMRKPTPTQHPNAT